MALEEAPQNKMVTSPPAKKIESPQIQVFHFAGSGKYHPAAIKAATIEAAEAEWLKVRVPVDTAPSDQLPTNPES